MKIQFCCIEVLKIKYKHKIYSNTTHILYNTKPVLTICLHESLLKMIGINIRVMMVPWSILILYNSIFHWTLFSNKPSLNAWMNLPRMFLLSFPDVSTFCPILHYSISLLLKKLSFNFLHWLFCCHWWEEF